MAATERSTSAAVVRQLDTEIRIRRRPCQVVAPIQHSPERCTLSTTRSVRASSPKLTKTWFRTTSLAIVTPSIASELLGKAASQGAAPLDELGDAGAAKLAQGGPGREPAGPARRLEHVVARRPQAALALSGQVGSGERHAGRVGVGVGAEGVADVVGDVEPLVAVGRPRVGRPRCRP